MQKDIFGRLRAERRPICNKVQSNVNEEKKIVIIKTIFRIIIRSYFILSKLKNFSRLFERLNQNTICTQQYIFYAATSDRVTITLL